MFIFRSIFVVALILALSNRAAALLGPLWHYAMIAEGPDGEISAVPVISATTTIEPPALSTPTASNSAPVVTSIITAAVEQSATDTSPGSKETNTEDPEFPFSLSRTDVNGGMHVTAQVIIALIPVCILFAV